MSWRMRCACCRLPLGELPPPALGEMTCLACGEPHLCVDGVWDLLPPSRAARFARFLDEYGRVRHAEGRGGSAPEHYRRLPEVEPTHPYAWQWRIRAASSRWLLDEVLGPAAGGQKVLDLGAGNGWLSHRLALAGHRPMAVDLWADPVDGLGAARHFDAVLAQPFPRLRADFDDLPVADGEADLVVFNAAFHYSTDYDRTLGEAWRVTRPGGRVAILDSPVYPSAADGRAMVAERKSRFRTTYGYPSDALGSREYLAEDELAVLADRHGLTWRVGRPSYGLRWALRPWKARLLGRRKPAQFRVLVAERRA